MRLLTIFVFSMAISAHAEPVGNKTGYLQPTSVEQLEARIKDHLKKQITLYEYQPQPKTGQTIDANAAETVVQESVVVKEVVKRPVVRAASAPQQPKASSTNVQVQGVDEADWVKNDERYLFAINNEKASGVRIFDTQNLKGQQPKQIGVFGVNQGVRLSGMYYLPEKRQLILLGESYERGGKAVHHYGYWSNDARTHVMTVDVKNPSKPIIVQSLKMDGSFRQTRRINNQLYLILNHTIGAAYPENHRDIATKKPLTEKQKEAIKKQIADKIDQWTLKGTLPTYTYTGSTSQPLLGANSLYLPEQTDSVYQLSSMVALNLAVPKATPQVVAYPEYVETLYMSDKSVYLTSSTYDITKTASGIPINNLGGSLIHKFSLKGQGFNYRGSGLVVGSFGWNELSSFQMDEDSKGVLRLVTFTSQWGRTNSHPEPVTRSPVVVTTMAENPQGKQLVTLSRLPNKSQPKPLGKPGETLYGARLINDYAYFVTFRNTDPLYVVDLHNPRQLKVTGELVIPGFSDYLHPINDQLLLGIGKASEDTGRVQGWKLSLFDVSNPNKPTEVSKVELGGRGSDSPANRNHHAVTTLAINEAITRVALPVNVVGESQVSSGIHRFEVNAPKKQLTHKGGFNLAVTNNNWYWNEQDRSVLIGNNLYYYRNGNFYATHW